jgi:hypothetical protein
MLGPAGEGGSKQAGPLPHCPVSLPSLGSVVSKLLRGADCRRTALKEHFLPWPQLLPAQSYQHLTSSPSSQGSLVAMRASKLPAQRPRAPQQPEGSQCPDTQPAWAHPEVLAFRPGNETPRTGFGVWSPRLCLNPSGYHLSPSSPSFLLASLPLWVSSHAFLHPK